MITRTWKERVVWRDHLEKYCNLWLKATASPSPPCRENARRIYTLTSHSFPPFSYCCFALAEPKLKPEDKGTHWFSTRSSVFFGHRRGCRRLESDVEGWTDSIQASTIIDLEMGKKSWLSMLQSTLVYPWSFDYTFKQYPCWLSIYISPRNTLDFISHLNIPVGQASLAAIAVVTSTLFL